MKGIVRSALLAIILLTAAILLVEIGMIGVQALTSSAVKLVSARYFMEIVVVVAVIGSYFLVRDWLLKSGGNDK